MKIDPLIKIKIYFRGSPYFLLWRLKIYNNNKIINTVKKRVVKFYYCFFFNKIKNNNKIIKFYIMI
jgi:hypothetical protein